MTYELGAGPVAAVIINHAARVPNSVMIAMSAGRESAGGRSPSSPGRARRTLSKRDCGFFPPRDSVIAKPSDLAAVLESVVIRSTYRQYTSLTFDHKPLNARRFTESEIRRIYHVKRQLAGFTISKYWGLFREKRKRVILFAVLLLLLCYSGLCREVRDKPTVGFI